MALKSKKTQTKNSESKVKHIGLVKNDAYLAPYEEAIKGRHDHRDNFGRKHFLCYNIQAD
jgi:1,4-alpha-glucan branching enzyme